MFSKTEERKIIKIEKIEAEEEIVNLIDAINHKKSIFDERIIKKIGENVGLKTSDAKVYKLFSALTEHFVDDFITSINHKRHSELIDIDKKLTEATKDSLIKRNKSQEKTNPA